MWSSLALAAALSATPAQAGGLQLTNVRMTIGELGPARPDTKFLPGDMLFVGYDIEGLTIDPDGTAKYTMAMELTDAAGKPIFKQDPREHADFVPLRGNKMPARAYVIIGLDQEPGAYTCKVTVTDPKTKAASSLSVKFDVLKRDFGIVAVYTSYDVLGERTAPTVGIVGQSLFIQFMVASFARDPKTKHPNVEIEYNILDDKGQPTMPQPIRYVQDDKAANSVKPEEAAFGMRFPLFMSRPGKFTVRVTATDKVANKKSTYDLPITVNPSN